MKNKELLIQLYREMNQEYQGYVRVIDVVRKLNSIIDDTRDVSILSDEDLELFDNDGKFIVENIKFVSTFRLSSFTKDEKINSLNHIKEQLIKGLDNSLEYYENLDEILKYFSNLEESLDNIQLGNSLVMEFIEYCYRNKKMTLEQAISCNFDIAAEILNKPEDFDEIEEVIYENEESINDELVELFKKYGYDFDKLSDKVKNKFNKYARLDYTEYILSKLSEYGVKQLEIKANEKAILKIIIDSKNNTFDDICEFVTNNNCKLSTMLSFDSIFHRRKKKYITKKCDGNKDREYTSVSDVDLAVIGNYDDSIKNIELLKSSNANSNKSLDELLKKAHTFVAEPHNKILKNLEILRVYGIVGKDEIPKDVSCLIGSFTAYQLDRFIEVGLEDYIKKNTSYVIRPKSPFKFYKIRRGNDLGDVITRGRGIKKEYNDDNIDMYGISRIQYGDDIRITQKYLTIDEMKSIPIERKRMITLNNGRLPKAEYYKKLYKDSYWYQEFTPSKIFSRDDLSVSYIIDSIFQSDDYGCNYALSDIYDNEYVKALDNYSCYTDNGDYSLKLDENTYEFKPYRYPHLGIKISRQKVLRLYYLLKENGILLDNTMSFDTKVNILLSGIVKDSILSYWEFNYIRRILKNIVEGLEKSKDSSNERGARK